MLHNVECGSTESLKSYFSIAEEINLLGNNVVTINSKMFIVWRKKIKSLGVNSTTKNTSLI